MLEPLDRCRRDSTLFQFTSKRLRDFIDPCLASTTSAGPVASPENVTETLAPGARSNQGQFW